MVNKFDVKKEQIRPANETYKDVLEQDRKSEVTGIVGNCFWLNLRKEPFEDAEIIQEIPCSTDVKIDLDKSTDKFYKVSVESVGEGFCMKDFVIVKKK